MLGKQRLTIGVSYGRIALDWSVLREWAWALIPPLLLALTFLSLVLLSEPPRNSTDMDGPSLPMPTTNSELYAHYADWQPIDGNYLPSRPVLR